MPMLTTKSAETRIEALEEQLERAENTVTAIRGALQDAGWWLAQFKQQDADVSASAQKLVDEAMALASRDGLPSPPPAPPQ